MILDHYYLNSSIAKDVIEKIGYVAADFHAEMETAMNSKFEKLYLFPSVHTYFGHEVFLCPEALFQPSLLGRDSFGIHETINDSIMRCDVDIIEELYQNIIVVGETNM